MAFCKRHVGQWRFGNRPPSGAHRLKRQPGLIGLDAALARMCRGVSYPSSRPDFSRWLEPALKPLVLRAVRTVTWDPVTDCGCRSRAAKRLPGGNGPARAHPVGRRQPRGEDSGLVGGSHWEAPSETGVKLSASRSPRPHEPPVIQPAARPDNNVAAELTNFGQFLRQQFVGATWTSSAGKRRASHSRSSVHS